MDNEQMIANLHASIQQKARDFLVKATQAGFNLRITHGYRSIEEQNALYAQGRTKPGAIVTNARGGQSFHNFGMAFDVVDTKAGYNINWDKLGEIGRSVGLEHGDRGYVDKPHFQYREGLSLEQVQKGARPKVEAPKQPEKPEQNNQPNEKRMIKLLENHSLVWIKAEGKDTAEFWVIRKNPKHPLETRHKVKTQVDEVVALFGQYGKMKRVNWPDIVGLTEKDSFDLHNKIITKPELFEAV